MRKSNYALITALYASKTRGLYSDIYFPIIRYALAKVFSTGNFENKYRCADDVSNFIDEHFGIKIPSIVIAKSVCKISNSHDSDIDLTVYENGFSFHINKAALNSEDLDVEEKEREFSKSISEIESEYQSFLREHGCVDDKVTFLQFISDNTDDVLGYFDSENKTEVDDKYVTLILFLQFLNDSDKALYEIVNQLFWSSIIVAFLKSDKVLVDADENGIKTEYFLDTSIILGLLDLSTPLRETYSKEVCSIILNSGGILRVNPMTIEEVCQILQSVEQNGPFPLTDIASAYDRRNLCVNDLAKIRINLEKILSEKHVDVYPAMSPPEIYKIKNQFRGKEITQLLAKARSKSESYSRDNFREIHDVYMDSYIKNRRKERKYDGYVHFLTDNRNLVQFCHAQHEGKDYMQTTSKVILELWMHNPQAVDISNCALTETMAHCLDLHRSKVRYKILEVSRFYNKTKANFDLQVYKDFIGNLYRRAKNAISLSESLTETMPPNFDQQIKEAVRKDNEIYNNSLVKVQRSNQVLIKEAERRKKQIGKINEKIGELELQNKEQNKQIDDLVSEKDELSKDLKAHQNQLKKTQEEKEEAKAIILLYKKRDELQVQIKRIEDRLTPLARKRQNSFKNRWPKFMYVSGVLLIVIGLIISIDCFILGEVALCISVLALFVTVSGLIFRRANTLRDNEKERSAKAYEKWENREENKAYRMLIGEQCDLKKNLSVTENQINEYQNKKNA